MIILDESSKVRESEYKVLDLIKGRWSPRAMTGETISKDELFSLFEAAKWAPSASNEQPWRILYALRGTPDWDLFFNLFVEGNQIWVKNAAAILIFLSKKINSRGGDSVTHSYDTGAAWENLALQAVSQNLVVHGMAGFDYERAKKDLNIPDHMRVEASAAVGKPAPKETLPEKLAAREVPSTRRPLEKTVAQGQWTEEIA